MAESLMELYKEFLPHHWNQAALDAISFSMTVVPFRDWRNERDEVRYIWDTSFNIRYSNAMITLHNVHDDADLTLTEAKMRLVREAIETFVKEVKLRRRRRGLPRLWRREWLNPADLDTDYTGYVFYSIDENAGGRFFISDCHRTLNFFIDPPIVAMDGSKTLAKRNRSLNDRQLLVLLAISKGVGTWLNRVKVLRKKYDKIVAANAKLDRGK